MPFDARQTALDILNTLDIGKVTLDSILEDIYVAGTAESRRNRALLQALVYGVLRWRGRLDYVIRHLSNTRIDKLKPEVLNILRLALFQIIYLDRIPNSAAVNTAVELAKRSQAPWVVGYVNALLRRAAREHQNISLPDTKKREIAAMAVQKSFPEWIIGRWLNRYGWKNTAALCDSLNAIPPITVRTNTLKVSPGQLLEALSAEAEDVRPTPYSPDGITFVHPATSIPGLSAFKAGWFQVQDEGAQLVSMLLDPQPGQIVLDACAGLGGKTGHIGQLMKNQGVLLAVDVNQSKLLRLKSEMHRLGISILSALCHDLERGTPKMQFSGFDRILLDAPCSGLGVMRRNPDIRWRKLKKNLTQYKAKQIRLLENLAPLVKISGILVYAVCSPEPEENQEVIDEFLKKFPEFVMDKEIGQLPDKLDPTAVSKGVFQTFPHLHQMDGFYAVRLKRIP
jgi:16S rRNA (cytosine967-C5)-methyltransferase